MKKYYLLLLGALLGIATSHAKKEPDFAAQDYAKYNIDDFDGVADGTADFIKAARNIMVNFGLDKNGYVGQSTIIDCPGMNKQEIYTQAVLWFESFCSKDKKAELRLDPNQGSTLIARKRLNNVTDKEFITGLGIKKKKIPELDGKIVNLLINIRLDIKDEKCRLTTTIEDYGIHTPQNNTGAWANAILKGPAGLVGAAIGSAIATAMNVDEKMKPSNNFPFVDIYGGSFREKKEGESEKKYEKEKQKHTEWYNKPSTQYRLYGTESVAYVSSFLVTQIVHDKMVAAITSSPSYGNDNEW